MRQGRVGAVNRVRPAKKAALTSPFFCACEVRAGNAGRLCRPRRTRNSILDSFGCGPTENRPPERPDVSRGGRCRARRSRRSISPCCGPSHCRLRQTKPVSTSARCRFSKLLGLACAGLGDLHADVTLLDDDQLLLLAKAVGAGRRSRCAPAARRRETRSCAGPAGAMSASGIAVHQRVGPARRSRQQVPADPARPGDPRPAQGERLADADE